MRCASALAVMKRDQGVSIIDHLLIAQDPRSTAMPLPVCREHSEPISVLSGESLTQPISSSSSTADDLDLFFPLSRQHMPDMPLQQLIV